MAKIIITKGDFGKTFEVALGDLIFIKLEENPTTGYRWRVTETDKRKICIKDSLFSAYSNSGIGGGGTRTFIFESICVGHAKIMLSNTREWEIEKPLEYFDVLINIQDK